MRCVVHVRWWPSAAHVGFDVVNTCSICQAGDDGQRTEPRAPSRWCRRAPSERAPSRMGAAAAAPSCAMHLMMSAAVSVTDAVEACDNGHQSVGISQWASVSGHQSVGISQWASVSGHQSVGISQWTYLRGVKTAQRAAAPAPPPPPAPPAVQWGLLCDCRVHSSRPPLPPPQPCSARGGPGPEPSMCPPVPWPWVHAVV